jgi:prolyl-tRNA synthetase
MKDSYSFHADEDDFKKEYNKMKTVYQTIFNRFGLKTIVVEADNGYIGGDYCHEFVVESQAGESIFLSNSDDSLAIHKDIVERKKLSEAEISAMKEKRAMEVGNIFQLGYHYSKKMKDALFTDSDGEKKPFYMGCYGIGIARTMAAIVEIYHDERGIIWPKSVAPYQVHLAGLDLKDNKIKTVAYSIYDQLINKNIEVLFDDRTDVSAGEKFADADLIGIPTRLVVSKRTGDKIEYKKRHSNQSELLTFNEAINKI